MHAGVLQAAVALEAKGSIWGMAGDVGKPGFTPSFQPHFCGAEQAGSCLSFLIWVLLPREWCGAGRKPLKKRGVCVFCKKMFSESAEDSLD